MNTTLKYMPVFRLKEEEKKLLNDFEFGNHMIPCIEIFKEFERQTPQCLSKSFKDTYVPFIEKIKSKRVFVDLPTSLTPGKNMEPEVLDFVLTVLGSRTKRTEYMLELADVSNKIIPIISTYSQRTGEIGSILKQENDLRSTYHTIAFRTFEKTIASDIEQIKKVARSQDFIIVDLGENSVKPEEAYLMQAVQDELASFNSCPIVIMASAIPNDLANTELIHNQLIPKGDNHLLKSYRTIGGHSFGDYAGIKRPSLTKGGGISPGFIFYDAVENQYYGFRGADGKSKTLADFERIISPDVYNSPAAKRMQNCELFYLGTQNKGWGMLADILFKGESGKSAAKFKRISMEHYLHCMKVKINAGQFN